jgi:hypothetical protein
VALLRSNPPAPTEEPSCTTALTREGGNCSVSRKKLFIYLFIYSLKHCNPPASTEEPSCTTAPLWGQGDCNATEPPANIGGGGGLNFF